MRQVALKISARPSVHCTANSKNDLKCYAALNNFVSCFCRKKSDICLLIFCYKFHLVLNDERNIILFLNMHCRYLVEKRVKITSCFARWGVVVWIDILFRSRSGVRTPATPSQKIPLLCPLHLHFCILKHKVEFIRPVCFALRKYEYHIQMQYVIRPISVSVISPRLHDLSPIKIEPYFGEKH